MVITIEPGMLQVDLRFRHSRCLMIGCRGGTTRTGVYVPADPQFPKHFHGLGMRIEDEVLVGAEHPVVLSASAPKEVCHFCASLTLHYV